MCTSKNILFYNNPFRRAPYDRCDFKTAWNCGYDDVFSKETFFFFCLFGFSVTVRVSNIFFFSYYILFMMREGGKNDNKRTVYRNNKIRDKWNWMIFENKLTSFSSYSVSHNFIRIKCVNGMSLVGQCANHCDIRGKKTLHGVRL